MFSFKISYVKESNFYDWTLFRSLETGKYQISDPSNGQNGVALVYWIWIAFWMVQPLHSRHLMNRFFAKMASLILVMTLFSSVSMAEVHIEFFCDPRSPIASMEHDSNDWGYYSVASTKISCEEKKVYQNLTNILYGVWTVATVASMCDPTIVISKVGVVLGAGIIQGIDMYVSNIECEDYSDIRKQQRSREKFIHDVKQEMCKMMHDQNLDCDPNLIDLSYSDQRFL
ncbi:MAG: hypothetical protein KDD61_15125 [Bdellovibrionales bacterium]|nr:hypothetical protein [Bdellovibrionales bacterium]